MKLKFFVRQSNGEEKSYTTVQEAFAIGKACEQSASVTPSTAHYPICLIEDEDGRRFGPVLRP